MNVDTQKSKRHQSKAPAVEQANPHLLAQQSQFILQTEAFVHQHADGHGQRLGTYIARHVQHQRLEADDDGQRGNNGFKNTDHGGNTHAQKQQRNKPRQTLFHADDGGLPQILLRGQAAQLGVVVAHGVVHQFHQILRGEDTGNFSVLCQHRQRIFFVLRDPVDAVLYLFVGENIGIAAADDALQRIVFPCDDQILQVDGTGEYAVSIHHIQCGDVVMLTGLPHQLAHGTANGQRIRNADEIAAHAAADLRLVKGQQPPDIIPGVVIKMGGNGLFLFCRKLPQNLQCIPSIHVGNHLCRQRFWQIGQAMGGIVQIGEDLRQRLSVQ